MFVNVNFFLDNWLSELWKKGPLEEPLTFQTTGESDDSSLPSHLFPMEMIAYCKLYGYDSNIGSSFDCKDLFFPILTDTGMQT